MELRDRLGCTALVLWMVLGWVAVLSWNAAWMAFAAVAFLWLILSLDLFL